MGDRSARQGQGPPGTAETEKMLPGLLRLSIENHTIRCLLPALWLSSDPLHHLLGQRRPFLTAKRLLTNQTFRDLSITPTHSIPIDDLRLQASLFCLPISKALRHFMNA